MAKRAQKTLITLTDEKGVDHDFEPLELFTAGKKNFALLQPAKTKKNEVAIFRFTMDKEGRPKTFVAPTEKEFELAIEALEADVECGCGGGCCCEEEADCCHEPEKKPAKKKATAAKKPAKKAARKASRK
ncbi:MAG TPA: DUF1292 domain-containing protein [Myxococcales bacterium]|jgi:uncharacterized protein YrzB (UPF0473 family)